MILGLPGKWDKNPCNIQIAFFSTAHSSVGMTGVIIHK